jgi:hypothetical protein
MYEMSPPLMQGGMNTPEKVGAGALVLAGMPPTFGEARDPDGTSRGCDSLGGVKRNSSPACKAGNVGSNPTWGGSFRCNKLYILWT